MKLIQFKSNSPLTPFAPYWCYNMAEFEAAIDSTLLDKLKHYILSLEQNTITKYSKEYNLYNNENNITFDGDTGLGSNSLTSRSPFYNLLKDESDIIQTLKLKIYESYTCFLESLGVKKQNAWIQCWANVMRSDETINEHVHASHELTWLGGHVTICTENTSTFYKNPMQQQHGFDVYESVNNPGQVTIFQDNIPHYTSTYNGDDVRISIAFDIIIEERYNQLSENRKQKYMRFDYE